MMRGAPLGRGTVAGLGRVVVFQDLDNEDKLLILDRHDEWRAVAADRVKFDNQRKDKTDGK